MSEDSTRLAEIVKAFRACGQELDPGEIGKQFRYETGRELPVEELQRLIGKHRGGSDGKHHSGGGEVE